MGYRMMAPDMCILFNALVRESLSQAFIIFFLQLKTSKILSRGSFGIYDTMSQSVVTLVIAQLNFYVTVVDHVPVISPVLLSPLVLLASGSHSAQPVDLHFRSHM